MNLTPLKLPLPLGSFMIGISLLALRLNFTNLLSEVFSPLMIVISIPPHSILQIIDPRRIRMRLIIMKIMQSHQLVLQSRHLIVQLELLLLEVLS